MVVIKNRTRRFVVTEDMAWAHLFATKIFKDRVEEFLKINDESVYFLYNAQITSYAAELLAKKFLKMKQIEEYEGYERYRYDHEMIQITEEYEPKKKKKVNC